MPEIPPAFLNSDRLILRKPVMEDSASIFDLYAQDREVTRYLTWTPHQSLSDTKNFVRRCVKSWEEGVAFPWTIIRKSDSQLLGMIEITAIDHSGANLGFVLARKFWKNGYMSEALKLIIDWALSQNDIYRIWAICDIENSDSKSVLERCGMQCEGILRRWLKLPQFGKIPRDFFCYSMIK